MSNFGGGSWMMLFLESFFGNGEAVQVIDDGSRSKSSSLSGRGSSLEDAMVFGT